MTGNTRRSGLLKSRDREWLDGNTSGKDRKYRIKLGVANTISDIEYLLNLDIDQVTDPSVDGLSEFFDLVEAKSGISYRQTAEYLITLAFIITNEPIDYNPIAEDIILHPRDESEGEMPRDNDRSTKGAAVLFNQTVADPLTFRNALSNGIKKGKEYLEPEEHAPEKVIIKSNTDLYKKPTADRLRREVFDGEDMRDAAASVLDQARGAESAGVDGAIDQAEAKIQAESFVREGVLNHLNTEINGAIEHEISARQNNHAVKDHSLPASSLSESGQINVNSSALDEFREFKKELSSNLDSDEEISDTEAIAQLLENAGEINDADKLIEEA